ncbi:hypothetical protein BC628DRAFT_1394521 [Trametes gibbosa]|nr:hypothetical protein BC628DRAFT_1394521 [Trametes gibbosa]
MRAERVRRRALHDGRGLLLHAAAVRLSPAAGRDHGRRGELYAGWASASLRWWLGG